MRIGGSRALLAAVTAALLGAIPAFSQKTLAADPTPPGASAPALGAPDLGAPDLGPPDLGPPDLGLRAGLEPQALDLLRAMSRRLAAARTMTFDATAMYESPARTGEPLAYLTVSQVAMQRPDKLRVVTPGDGPPSDFYYDGKTMTAFSPDDDMAAVAPAPPTIDAMLKAAYAKAAIYFPFDDMIVADPYGDVAGKLKLAFVVGKSHVVGAVETDIVVAADEHVHAQIWIGTQDHLPRMMRATFFDEPGQFRHQVIFSDWRLDADLPADTFVSAQAAAAKRIAFAPPTPAPSVGSVTP